MSTRIGTLQPKARIQPVWPVAVLALLVAAVFVAIVTSPDRTRPGDGTTSIGSTAANTPTELSGGIVGSSVAANTAANTPTELSGGIVGSVVDAPVSTGAFATHGKQLGIDVVQTVAANTAANTPTELTGGIGLSAAAFGGAVELVPHANQLGLDIGTVVPSAGDTIIVNGEVCEICWKYK